MRWGLLRSPLHRPKGLLREGALGLPSQLAACVYRQPQSRGVQQTRQAGPAEAVEAQIGDVPNDNRDDTDDETAGTRGAEEDDTGERDEFNVGVADRDVADYARQIKHAEIGFRHKVKRVKVQAKRHDAEAAQAAHEADRKDPEKQKQAEDAHAEQVRALSLAIREQHAQRVSIPPASAANDEAFSRANTQAI